MPPFATLKASSIVVMYPFAIHGWLNPRMVLHG